jgi:predicted RNA polymerase sigma factor
MRGYPICRVLTELREAEPRAMGYVAMLKLNSTRR